MDNEPKLPPPTPVTDASQEFANIRDKYNTLLNKIVEAAPQGAVSARAVRCGGGCHQGVID